MATDNPTATTPHRLTLSDRFEWDAREACESLEKIRDVLLIGLASFGEIERLEDAQKIEKRSREIPEHLRVIHPTGCSDTVSDFAEALIYVGQVMRQIRDWAVQARAPEEPEALPLSP